MEIQDLLQWLENTDLRLSSSKTMWGMPDSASERLSAHLVKSGAAFVLTALTRVSNGDTHPCLSFHLQKELCTEMDSKLRTYTDVKNAVNRMLEGSNVVRGSSTEHTLSILEQKWASVYSKIQERKV